jgi:hypothetical protein
MRVPMCVLCAQGLRCDQLTCNPPDLWYTLCAQCVQCVYVVLCGIASFELTHSRLAMRRSGAHGQCARGNNCTCAADYTVRARVCVCVCASGIVPVYVRYLTAPLGCDLQRVRRSHASADTQAVEVRDVVDVIVLHAVDHGPLSLNDLNLNLNQFSLEHSVGGGLKSVHGVVLALRVGVRALRVFYVHVLGAAWTILVIFLAFLVLCIIALVVTGALCAALVRWSHCARAQASS